MRDEPRSHRPISELARRQHGIISIWQLVELGFSKDEISRGTTKGKFHQIHHGVYAVGHTSLSRQGRCIAGVLSCGDGALLSHRSAAWLWGLTKWWPPIVEVTAVSPRETRQRIRVHSAAALFPEDKSVAEGVPVTAGPRTLLDFAAVEPHFLGGAWSRRSDSAFLT